MVQVHTKTEVIVKLRKELDVVDREIVTLLGKRFKLTRKVGEYKAKYDLPAKDPVREREVYADRRAWAKKAGLDENFAEKLFAFIIAAVRQKHTAIKKVQGGV